MNSTVKEVIEVTVDEKKMFIFGRRQDEEIIFYNIAEPTEEEIFLKLPLPNKKQWVNDSYFIKKICEAYNLWNSNTIG